MLNTIAVIPEDYKSNKTSIIHGTNDRVSAVFQFLHRTIKLFLFSYRDFTVTNIIHVL